MEIIVVSTVSILYELEIKMMTIIIITIKSMIITLRLGNTGL